MRLLMKRFRPFVSTESLLAKERDLGCRGRTGPGTVCEICRKITKDVKLDRTAGPVRNLWYLAGEMRFTPAGKVL